MLPNVSGMKILEDIRSMVAAQAIKADFLRDPHAPDRNAVALRQC